MSADRYRIEFLPGDYTLCKLRSVPGPVRTDGLYFLLLTVTEISLVCRSCDLPSGVIKSDGGWRAMRIAGTLDLSLTGILSGITAVLAEKKIPVFAVSTFDTDYILVKSAGAERAADALREAGYRVSA